MPIYDDAEAIIKNNLQIIAAGYKAKIMPIGILTDEQHREINVFRQKFFLQPLENPEILYIGRHHYTSRTADGYGIHDMWLQIHAALATNSIILGNAKMTALQAIDPRSDGYGNLVHDMAILELTSRKPRAELFSCIPKGDKFKPNQDTQRPCR